MTYLMQYFQLMIWSDFQIANEYNLNSLQLFRSLAYRSISPADGEHFNIEAIGASHPSS